MSDQPLTPEQAAISHAWQEMFQKAVHFDETLLVINHWLMNVYDWTIQPDHGTWRAYKLDGTAEDICRETYSQCLATVLDHLSGREEGS